MRKFSRSLAALGGMVLLCAAASFAGQTTTTGCPGNQNPNAAAHGAGKTCTQGNNSNVALYQPIRLKLNIKAGQTCPDAMVPILVSPDIAVVHRDGPPNRVNWIVTGKAQETMWEIQGVATRWQHGATIPGANPFPGTMTISGSDDAYWTDDIDSSFPTPTTTSIEWEYSIKVSWSGEQPECAPVEIDPIIIIPGG